MFQDVDHALSQRVLPAMPEGLADRILLQAAHTRQKTARPASWTHKIQDFLDDFAGMIFLPKPAYAVFALVVLGLGIGIFASHSGSFAENALPTVTPYELASFMVIEDRFVAGEWI